MGRTARDRRDLPHPKPVKHIRLSDQEWRRRFIAVVALLLIGGVCLGYGVMQLMTGQAGWQTITASTSLGPTCAGEFTFLYEAGRNGGSAAEVRAVTGLYTQSARRAYQIFSMDEHFEGVGNLYDLNAHPNETVTVDRVLYDALSLLQTAGDRSIYLGGVTTRYDDILSCTDDVQTADFDPLQSEAVAREYARTAAFASDPQAVDLELLGQCQVRLRVSQDYLRYAEEEGLNAFLDLGWMKNAFIADYLAQTMLDAGYTAGVLSSYDGFTRCLDTGGTDYALPVYDAVGTGFCAAATLEYRGPMSIAALRSFPVTRQDPQRFYVFADGAVRHLYLDPRDGLPRTALPALTGWAGDKSCAQLLLELKGVFLSDSLDPQVLASLEVGGTHTVYCRDAQVISSTPEAKFTDLFAGEGISYRLTAGG